MTVNSRRNCRDGLCPRRLLFGHMHRMRLWCAVAGTFARVSSAQWDLKISIGSPAYRVWMRELSWGRQLAIAQRKLVAFSRMPLFQIQLLNMFAAWGLNELMNTPEFASWMCSQKTETGAREWSWSAKQIPVGVLQHMRAWLALFHAYCALRNHPCIFKPVDTVKLLAMSTAVVNNSYVYARPVQGAGAGTSPGPQPSRWLPAWSLLPSYWHHSCHQHGSAGFHHGFLWCTLMWSSPPSTSLRSLHQRIMINCQQMPCSGPHRSSSTS